ncbi:hypothetical protein [Streptomyces goshikiensis]|uniref:hypothetical protein n=1 Tax=Streptomyces goshikiensis TaxID=1942 RepID=UPI0036948562
MSRLLLGLYGPASGALVRALPVVDEALRPLPGGTGTDTSSGAWKSSRPRGGPAVT